MSKINNSSADLSQEEVTRIVSERLPSWKAACDREDVDSVILTQQAFGNSSEELLLLAVAIKYAGLSGKNVTIVRGKGHQYTR